MQVAFVGNPGARQGTKIQQALAYLEAEGLDVAAHLPEQPEGIAAALQAASKARRIVVAGGDGTVTAAIQALAGRRTELAILPMGTQNNFARSLRIPLELDDACRLAAHGKPRTVDVGRVGDHLFANTVTIGLSSTVARETAPWLKRIFGRIAYGLVAAREMAEATPFACTLETPEGDHDVVTFQLVVANGRRVAEGLAAPGASAKDGMLDVVALGGQTRRGLTGAWLDLRRGRHTQRDDTLHVRVPEVRIVADPPQQLDVDGELRGMTPATVRVERGALRVVAP